MENRSYYNFDYNIRSFSDKMLIIYSEITGKGLLDKYKNI